MHKIPVHAPGPQLDTAAITEMLHATATDAFRIRCCLRASRLSTWVSHHSDSVASNLFDTQWLQKLAIHLRTQQNSFFRTIMMHVWFERLMRWMPSRHFDLVCDGNDTMRWWSQVAGILLPASWSWEAVAWVFVASVTHMFTVASSGNAASGIHGCSQKRSQVMLFHALGIQLRSSLAKVAECKKANSTKLM